MGIIILAVIKYIISFCAVCYLLILFRKISIQDYGGF